MERLEKLADRRNSIMSEVAQLRSEQASVESQVIEQLIDNRMFDLFSVNWRKLDRMIMRSLREENDYGR